MRRLVLLLTLLLLLPLFPRALAEGQTRLLLVGCDDFITQRDTWPASRDNVTAVRAALETALSPVAVTQDTGTLCDGESLHTLILTAAAGADGGDTLWFYISTHGLWEEGQANGDFAVLLSDGMDEARVTAAQLRAWFDEVPGHKVLIFDCCRSGAAIGKGTSNAFANTFAGADYTVICSSGGDEESWFWLSGTGTVGAGYFSGALVSALSAGTRYAADADRNGAVTLTELRRYLRENHGASTCQTYPEESDEVLVRYDAAAAAETRLTGTLTGLCFNGGTMSGDEPSVTFSFSLLRSARLAYQLVLKDSGSWDFSGSTLVVDSESANGLPMEPGYRGRTLWVDREDAGSSGYVLLQLLAFGSDDSAEVLASHVLCVPPQSGDPGLSARTSGSFCPEAGEELAVVVSHSEPCELTVTVEDLEGNTLRWLAASEPSRPQQLTPSGSTFSWTGRLQDGTAAAEGLYRVRVRTTIGGVRYEAVSEIFTLSVPKG